MLNLHLPAGEQSDNVEEHCMSSLRSICSRTAMRIVESMSNTPCLARQGQLKTGELISMVLCSRQRTRKHAAWQAECIGCAPGREREREREGGGGGGGITHASQRCMLTISATGAQI